MLKVLLSLLVLGVVVFIIWRVLVRVWYGLHRAAGIEVGTPTQALPQTAISPLSHRLNHQPNLSIPNSFGSDDRYQLAVAPSESRMWRTKHGKIPSMPHLAGVTVDRLNLMPTEAVVILDRIHDKLTRYQAWQAQHQLAGQRSHETPALTEKQFVIDKLINQTLPEAVNQYDQLARFNPYQLQQPIHDDMNAGDILIAVLQQVDGELDGLIHDLQSQVSNQLATTYRYVKARTQ